MMVMELRKKTYINALNVKMEHSISIIQRITREKYVIHAKTQVKL